MTPTIALIAVSLIAAGLCVAVGIMQWRIDQLKAENDRERARHEVTNELLTEARNETKTEYALRRQAERNLAVETDHAKYWEGLAKEWCEDVTKERTKSFNLEKQLSKYTRQRDPKTGRFYSAKVMPSTLIETDGLTARVVAKPHTLRHGMIVKDPTPEQAREIFDEAKRLGIECENPLEITDRYTWIYYGPQTSAIMSCRPIADDSDIYVTYAQFLSHMRGEDVETLCDEVKRNASAGI